MVLLNGDTRLDRITTMNRGGKKSKHRRSRRQKKIIKTRKVIGGTLDTSGYALVGFRGSGQIKRPGIPIFLPNEKSLKNENDLLRRIGIGSFGVHRVMLFLPVLYELNYRRLSLKSLEGQALYDIHEEFIYGIDFIGHNDQIALKEMQNKFREMELKYPGLFQRMFITEEEERQALEEIQKKEASHENETTSSSQLETKMNNLLSKIEMLESKNNELEKKIETMSRTQSNAWTENFRTTLNSIR